MKQQHKKEYKRRRKLIQSSRWEKRDHGRQYRGGCCALVRNRSSKVENRRRNWTENSQVDDQGAPHPKSDINFLYMPRGKC